MPWINSFSKTNFIEIFFSSLIGLDIGFSECNLISIIAEAKYSVVSKPELKVLDKITFFKNFGGILFFCFVMTCELF